MADGPEELLAKAKEATENCYCPYSGFHVTAVLEDENGGLHVGVNIENSSYGLTMCAERAAVFSAISNGQKKFKRILVYSPDGEPMPCGACREVLAEFCNDDFPVIVTTNNTVKYYSLAEILPHRFKTGRI
jgi:cytidine deaminase